MERLKTSVVGPDGPSDASIYFFGEAPGREENNSGVPFIGSAGMFHNRCLRQQGISRPETLHWNIFTQQPPRNDINYYFQDKDNTKLTWEGEEHVENLRQWLEKALGARNSMGGPNLLVALGAIPTFILTGKKRIMKWRGSVLPCSLVPGFKVYCMNHPSYVNRLINEPEERLVGKKKRWAENALPIYLMDLQRVIEQSEFPDIPIETRVFEAALSHRELLGRLEALANQKEGIVAIDIETLPGDEGPIVWCIGFSTSPSWAFVVPIIKEQRLAWTVQEEAKLWIAISKVFLNLNLKKVFQGGLQYDLPILGRYYGLRLAKETYEDTMWCHHATYPYLRKALETLCSIYTWEPYYKDEGKHSYGKRGTDQAEFRYNAKDCCVTREILPITWRNAKELGFWSGYQRTMSVAPSHLGMMLRGIRIDMRAKDQLSYKFQQKKDYFLEKLHEITGMETNINSNPQLQRLLYGYYDMPLHYHHKTKKVTTDQDAIAKLKKKYKKGGERFNVLDAISSFRKFAKLSSTYTGMEVDMDGRIHTTYKWVSTWRTSSSESPFGSGGNLQNIPNPRREEGRMVRKLFIPDEGMELLAADYSQAEARVVDWEAENLVNMELYKEGLDVHWEKTKATFAIPSDIEYSPKEMYRDNLTREEHSMKALRNLGKTVKHAGNYGEGPFMLQNTLAREGFYLDVATCKTLIQQAKRSDPMTVEWQRKIRDKVRGTRELISSFGRKRRFLGRMNDNLWRAAYAFSPQNTVGEILQVALQNVWERLDYVEVLLNVHDEIVCQIKPEDRERAISDIREQMTIPLTIHNRELIIPVDFKVGENWGEMEELDD